MAAWNTTVESSQDIYVARGIYTTTVVTLTGQVVDAQSLLPISGAEVSLDTGVFTTTNSSGYYTLTVDAGIYTATAQAAGYFPQVVPDLPLWSGTVVQDFSLQPEVTLTGQVSDASNSNPIMGAEVLLDTGAFTYTNPGGVYTFTLPPDIYTATAQAAGFIPQTVTGIELISGTVTQDFALEPFICSPPQILDVAVGVDRLTVSFSPTVSATLPVDYLWSFGDGITSTLPAPVHTYPDYGAYTVDLQVTNACGLATWSRDLELKRFIFLPVITKAGP
jgi:hypothetical protein